MFSTLFLSILFTTFQIIACIFLEAEPNYQKPKLERNNILNKGVWVRNKLRDNLFAKSSLGNFIFKANSLDADRLLQTKTGAFAGNDNDEIAFVPGYMGRVRRSPDHKGKRHSRKGVKSKKLKNSIDLKISSKVLPSTNPTSVFNEYPYEVAILLNNDRNNIINGSMNQTGSNVSVDAKNITENLSEVDNNTVNIIQADKKYSDETNDSSEDINKLYLTDDGNSAPKRSRKHNYGVDDEQINILDFNNTDTSERRIANRNVFDKDNRIWHQNAPIPDTNIYEVVPKDKEKSKGITERGLIKVISMLIKTFKKTMKQHNEFKQIYNKMNEINGDFTSQINDMNAKFQDFDSKYADMIQFSNKLKEFDDKMLNEEEILKIKHKNIEDNIIEFEKQQQTFLVQQKQFYAIQKVMLAQNEKINIKQNTIAKTQSEISHRQNNFARILKKTKQLFFDNRMVNNTKCDLKNDNQITTGNVITTISPITTDQPPIETIKLNLFNIAPKNKLANQDALIIKEKDESPIDDLVYKYYFNNTFIDNLMKSKILNNYASNTNSIEIARNVKNKRNEIETTILLPVGSNNAKKEDEEEKKRVRRWVSHFHDKKKPAATKVETKSNKLKAEVKSDPFLTMARSFCNEIGQNTNDQMLHWCIEKALRRLRFMDKKLFSKPVTVMKEKRPQILNRVTEQTTEKTGVTFPVAGTTLWLPTNIFEQVSTPLYAVPQNQIFFPDNEELESNLKQYDLTPDPEGIVYYDGSLHFSDIGRNIARDSDGMSDFMPGLIDSNSQVEMNPLAVDLQTKRRTAYVKRINEDIIQKIKSRRL